MVPGGGYGFRFFSPDGLPFEVSADVTRGTLRAMERWEGMPLKISHIVLHSPDHQAAVAFFTDVLGFRVSDWLGDFMCFLRCNTAHHRIALLPGPPCLNHVAYDMLTLDDMMRGVSRLRKLGTDIRWGPGRHTAGNNTFSYFCTPGGFAVEYTSELEEVDFDAHEDKVHEPGPQVMDQWGIGEGGPQTMPKPTPGPLPLSASGGLITWPCLNIFPITSGTCPLRSRWRAGGRSVKSSICANRSGMPRQAAPMPGTPQFMKQWVAMGESLVAMAAEDEAKGRNFSASNKLERASLYMLVGERMQAHGNPDRVETYAAARDAFDRSTKLGQLNRERVEIPLDGGTMSAIWTRAPGDGPKPAVVFCNGLDSSKEMLYWTRLPKELARRGISTLCVDQPGTGEALRLQNLPVDPHSESWASKAVDWLEMQDHVDSKRIGMTGISLGGHFAPRAVAYEPRFASGAVWGANHNWREVQDKRMEREGENPVPHYWAHVHWAFGADGQDDFLEKSSAMNLNGQYGPDHRAVSSDAWRERSTDQPKICR